MCLRVRRSPKANEMMSASIESDYKGAPDSYVLIGGRRKVLRQIMSILMSNDVPSVYVLAVVGDEIMTED